MKEDKVDEFGVATQHGGPTGDEKEEETEKERREPGTNHSVHDRGPGGFRDMAAACTALYNVCGAFEKVAQPDRLNFLCMIAQALKPLEARFLQLVLRENISSTAASLAELEALANDSPRINRLVGDRGLLSALHTVADLLPLLRVDNPQAGHSITHTLVQCTWHASPRAPEGSQDFCAVCQVAFTMATRHPAIDEAERTRLRRIHLDLLNKRQPVRPARRQEASSSSEAAQDTQGASSDGPGGIELDIDHREISSATIMGIEKDAFRNAYQFVTEVVWKSGQRTYCRRTHDQFYDFHLALMEKFPEESKKEHRTIPLLPGKSRLKQAFRRRSTKDLAKSRREGIQAYINGLIALPSKISRSTHVVSFFLSCPVCYGLLTDCTEGCVTPAQQLQPLPLPQQPLPPPPPPQQQQQAAYEIPAHTALPGYAAPPLGASPAHAPTAQGAFQGGHAHHQQQPGPVYMRMPSTGGSVPVPTPPQSMYPTPPFVQQSVGNPIPRFAQHPHHQQQQQQHYPVYHQQYMPPFQSHPPLHPYLHGPGAWASISARSSPGVTHAHTRPHTAGSPRRRPRQRNSTTQAVSRTPPLPSGRRPTTASLPDHLHRVVSSSSVHSATSTHLCHHDSDGGGDGRRSHGVFAEEGSTATSTASPASFQSATRPGKVEGGSEHNAKATATAAAAAAAATTTAAATSGRTQVASAAVNASASKAAAGKETSGRQEETAAGTAKDTPAHKASAIAAEPAPRSSSSSVSHNTGAGKEGGKTQREGKQEEQVKGQQKQPKEQQQDEQKQTQPPHQKQKQQQHTQGCPLCSSTGHTALSCYEVTCSREEICSYLEAINISTQASDTKDVCTVMSRRFWWLKQYRLHKYAAHFCRRTRAQMEAMTQEEFIALGLTKGASNKLYTKLHPKPAASRTSSASSPQPTPSSSSSSSSSGVPWPDIVEEEQGAESESIV